MCRTGASSKVKVVSAAALHVVSFLNNSITVQKARARLGRFMRTTHFGRDPHKEDSRFAGSALVYQCRKSHSGDFLPRAPLAKARDASVPEIALRRFPA